MTWLKLGSARQADSLTRQNNLSVKPTGLAVPVTYALTGRPKFIEWMRFYNH